MELLIRGLDLLLHVDLYLNALIAAYGPWVYAFLFVVIFCETGLVVTPFLPGDSLLFAIGAFASKGSLSPWTAFALLSAAAIVGDSANYWIGAKFGTRAFGKANARVFNAEALARTHAFYEKYGGKTIIIARFVPFVRTFAPFVAGIGRMRYPVFLRYNAAGGVLWIGSLIALGYFFGNLPVVRDHFSLVVFAIIVVSLMPAAIEMARRRRRGKRAAD